jgi:hypothetical protein
MRKRLDLILIVATLSAATAHAQPTFVGVWYSANQPDEPGVMSVIEFKADGTFREEFRKCENGSVVGYRSNRGRGRSWTTSSG